MARVKVPAGTIQKLEKVFDDLQTYQKANELAKFKLLCNDQLGIVVDNQNGTVVGTPFQITLADTNAAPTQFSVAPGVAYNENGDVITVNESYTQNSITSASANKYYIVFLQYAEQGAESITAMNAFLYDTGGVTPYSSKYSRFTDSFTTYVTNITSATGWQFANAPSMVPVAILKTDSTGRLDHTAWTYVDNIQSKTYTASAGIVDLRVENRLLIDTALLDDSKVLFKDRDSTNSSGGAINGNIQIMKNLTVGGTSFLSDDVAVVGKLTSYDGAGSHAIQIGNKTLPAGLPFSAENAGTAQSIAAGGSGHIAHLYGDTHRLTLRQRDHGGLTNIMQIYNYNPAGSGSFGDLTLGRSQGDGNNNDAGLFINASSTGQSSKISIGRHLNFAGTAHAATLLTDDESVVIHRGLVIDKTSPSTAGIVWRRVYDGNYSKKSLAIEPVDTHSWARSGMGFYTNNVATASGAETLRMAITRTGVTVIGQTDETTLESYSSNDGRLQVEGITKTAGITSTADINTTGVFTSTNTTGLNTLTGQLRVEGKSFLAGGLELTGPLVVSGLTTNGTFYNEVNQPSTDFIRFQAKQEDGTFHHKASIHLDGLSRAIVKLNDENNENWAHLTPSGTYFDTTDFAVGQRSQPNTQIFGTTMTVKGAGPAVIFRDTNGGTDTGILGSQRDWALGFNAIGSIVNLQLGKFISNNSFNAYMSVSDDGKFGLGTVPQTHDQTLGVLNGIYSAGENEFTADTKLRSASWSNGTGSNYNAGVNSNGRMTIYGDMQNTFPLAVGGPILTFGETAGVKFGDSSSSAAAALDYVDGIVKLTVGGETVLEGGTSTSGTYLPSVTTDAIIATRVQSGNEGLTVNGPLTSITEVTFNNGPVNFNDTPITASGSNAEFNLKDVPAENILISGVANSAFRVGVGTLGTGGAGLRVLTEAGDASRPQNIRLWDVKPDKEDPNSAHSKVVIKWNFEAIEGSGTGGVFTPNLGVNAFNDSLGNAPTLQDMQQLKGKRLRLKHAGGTSEYFISEVNTSTGALTLGRVALTDGNEGPQYGNESSVGPEHASIVEEADAVYVNFLEVDESGDHNTTTHLNIVVEIPEDYIHENQFMQILPIGKRFSIRVSSKRGTVQSAYSSHKAGRYDPDHSDPFGTVSGQSMVSYSQIWQNQLPMLVNDGTVGLTSTAFGFQANLTGWSDAEDDDKNPHEFEFAYSTDPGDVDFNTLNNTTVIKQTGRQIDVNTSVSTQYAVAVRALQNQQVVATSATKSVTSGAGGVPPSYTNYATANVNLSYWVADLDRHGDGNFSTSGDDLYFQGTDNSVLVTDLPSAYVEKTPFHDTDVAVSGISSQEGYKFGVLASEGSIFQIAEFMNEAMTSSFGFCRIFLSHGIGNHGKLTGQGKWFVSEYPAASPDTGLMSGFNTSTNKLVVGGTKFSRRLLEVTLDQDVDIKQVTIYIEQSTRLSPANPGIIRVYQKGNEANAATMMIKTSYGEVSQGMNVEILAQQGARTLIIDAFDPSSTSPNNKAGFMGVLNVYGSPHVHQETDQQGSTN